MVLEEGPQVDPDAHEPFSLAEMVAKYRHHGAGAAIGNPFIAYAEGRCVGGSTEINSGLYHRLPDHLAAEWQVRYAIDEFAAPAGGLRRPGRGPPRREHRAGAPPVVGRARARGHQAGVAQRRVPRVFSYDAQGRGTKQTMSRTMLPGRSPPGRRWCPTAACSASSARGDRVVGARCRRTHPGGGVERMTVHAEHVFVCGGAVHSRRCCSSAAASGATSATG